MEKPTLNPYQPPVDAADAPMQAQDTGMAEDERIRREHLNHEMSVKSISLLYFLGVLGLGVTLVMTLRVEPNLIFAGIAGVILVVLLVLGLGVRKLATWVRIPIIIWTSLAIVLSLINVAIIALAINVYILSLVASSKGKMVLSQEYQGIIARTPHVKYSTSKTTWIVLTICLAILALIVGYLVLFA